MTTTSVELKNISHKITESITKRKYLGGVNRDITFTSGWNSNSIPFSRASSICHQGEREIKQVNNHLNK
jgi:hypothetical protein